MTKPLSFLQPPFPLCGGVRETLTKRLSNRAQSWHCWILSLFPASLLPTGYSLSLSVSVCVSLCVFGEVSFRNFFLKNHLPCFFGTPGSRAYSLGWTAWSCNLDPRDPLSLHLQCWGSEGVPSLSASCVGAGAPAQVLTLVR